MNEKQALTPQRFPFYNIQKKKNGKLEWIYAKRECFHKMPASSDLETTEYLKGEKIFASKKTDSFNHLIAHADFVTPIGFRHYTK